jgi:uncharacterized protein (TIGR02118 family)
MISLITVIRKRPEISTEDFRRFLKHEYGPTYQAMPQVSAYIQYHVADLATDGAEEPIDAIVQITFNSPEAMTEALSTEAYRQAHAMRQKYMRETSTGIHSARIEETVTFK